MNNPNGPSREEQEDWQCALNDKADEGELAAYEEACALEQKVEPITLLPQPAPSFSNRACVECGEWSASGGPLCEDCAENAIDD